MATVSYKITASFCPADRSRLRDFDFVIKFVSQASYNDYAAKGYDGLIDKINKAIQTRTNDGEGWIISTPVSMYADIVDPVDIDLTV